MIPLEPHEVLTLDIHSLWNAYLILLEEIDAEGKPLKEIYEDRTHKIKYGIRLNLPIWYLTKQWYEEYPTSRKVKVVGHGKYPLDKFMEEKEEREQLMREALLDNIDDEGVTTPR